MANIKITQINPSQISEFFDLYKTIVTSDFGEWSADSKRQWLTKDYSPEFWQQTIVGDKCPTFIACDEDKMVGFLSIEQLNFGVAYLGWMGTLTHYRQHGIARQMLDALETWCQSHQIHKVELETQLPELIPVYEKLGFSLEGTRHNSWQHLDNFMFGKILTF